MKERFEILRRLLRTDRVFFCQLNDDEAAYCKVLLDEIFSRNNFINKYYLWFYINNIILYESPFNVKVKD